MSKEIINHHEQNLAYLKNKLQLPLIARDYLHDNQAPKDESRYALHDIMSNLAPQDALLCSAFIMKEINAFLNIDTQMLQNECDRLIEAYAGAHDHTTTQNTIDTLSADLIAFAEILDMCQISYDILNPKAADILGIITTQIHAQILIIDSVIEMIEAQNVQQRLLAQGTQISGYRADNVVMFPAHH